LQADSDDVSSSAPLRLAQLGSAAEVWRTIRGARLRTFCRSLTHWKIKMPWTLANLVIQIITGILGGHGAAAASKEHSFGAVGHTIAGAAGGALSGTFFQTYIGTVVTASGSVTEPTAFEQALIQAVTGAVVGGICTLLVGFIKRSIDEHKSSGR
jgi:hypothetical protein